MPDVLRSVINSDLTINISPVVMGFVSKYIKKANDRMIPLVHPYIGVFDNEWKDVIVKKHPRNQNLYLGKMETEIGDIDMAIISTGKSTLHKYFIRS